MVKVKNKKSTKADAITQKKETNLKKTLNPFEVHINNQKIKVLGRKVKNDRGLPGIARAKALAKRKHTLLPEYKLQNKSNSFHDKRIGEKNRGLSADDKAMARYAAVRMRQHSKKSIFQLGDDDVLTHKGQTLSEIEKFDDPRSDDEDAEDTGKLNSQFVDDAHFGGGILKKADGAKSHKDLIDQLISESKKRKADMQKQKEATMELTEKLDTEWKDLMPLMHKKQKTDEEPANKVDEFDKVMRELKFEARGIPSDKLKSEDEIAREEKEKLERLERERLERMHGVMDEPKTTYHRSADDLDDNFVYDNEPDEDMMLSYDTEGKSNVEIELKIGNKDKNTTDEEDNNDISSQEEEDESEAETEDDLSDLKVSESESSDDCNEVKPTSIQLRTKQSTKKEEGKPTSIQLTTKQSTKKEVSEDTSLKSILKNSHPTEEKKAVPEVKTTEEIKEDLLRRKEMMDKARHELPYTFPLPDNYESLQATLKEQSPEHQGIIIERMIKCNHPSLKEGNKENLGMLFIYLLQHLNDICEDIDSPATIQRIFKVFANLTPFMFDLAQLNPTNAGTSMIEVIKEKQNDSRGKKRYPGLEVLIYLKLISCLFSTSDFQHHVVTPSFMFMEGLLIKSRVKTKRDIAFGMFLTCLILEYTKLSKRILPAAIIFLNGVVHMALPKCSVRLIKVSPPFKAQCCLLVPSRKLTKSSKCKMEINDLFPSTKTEDIAEEFKHEAIHVAVSLLQQFHSQFQTLPSCVEIFETTLDYLKRMSLEYYDDGLQNAVNGLIETLTESAANRWMEYCKFDVVRPKAMRLYEPNIEKVYDAKKHKVQSKVKAERAKLLHKIKMEQKGAMREIRRDRTFLGRVKLDQKLQSDAARRKKVKQIYSEAAMQQSELNAMDRSNNRKKKK